MWVVTVGSRLTSEAYMESQGHSEGKLSKDSISFSYSFLERIIRPLANVTSGTLLYTILVSVPLYGLHI